MFPHRSTDPELQLELHQLLGELRKLNRQEQRVRARIKLLLRVMEERARTAGRFSAS